MMGTLGRRLHLAHAVHRAAVLAGDKSEDVRDPRP